MVIYLLLIILGSSIVAYFVGSSAGNRFADAAHIHSLPGYHGAFVAIWVGIPAFVLVLIWLMLQRPVVDSL
ncbi:MAG TPA: phosphate ABC transporter permease family protein, partial [Devosiaceae bacterium]|nr:phosphate ABC transporter permease family protein [Devosiaceae bacterium]